MAESDLEDYYRAGTLPAAFISLQHGAAASADFNKQKAIATTAMVQGAIITNVNSPLAPIVPVPSGPKHFPTGISQKDMKTLQTALCMANPAGLLDAETLSRATKFLQSVKPALKGIPAAGATLTTIDSRTWVLLNEKLLSTGKKADCSLFNP
jgi:hypothetical protein